MSNRAFVNWERDGAIATITLNNPPMNAVSQQLARELKECVEEIAADKEVVVVIVTGAGDRAFCAGADIKEFPNFLNANSRQFVENIHESINALDDLPKPTIAAINGWALGGGLEIAMACDLRVAAENAQMGQPEIKLGVIPGGGGTQRLTRLIGEPWAKEINFTGDPITAADAYRLGLVNRIVPRGEAYQVARGLAETIAARSGAALALIKRAMDEGIDKSLKDGLKVERDRFVESFRLEDAREGVDAFINKRPPAFKHR